MGGVNLQWESPIFRDLQAENPLTDRSLYVGAVAVFPLMQVTSPAVANDSRWQSWQTYYYILIYPVMVELIMFEP
jgi:hypothetical protein